MKITVIGTGYVGLVTGACLADVGNNVLCVDVDRKKIRALNDGRIPIFEPGLEPIVRRNREAGRLKFSTDVAASVAHGELQLIAVGTPPGEDGSADLQHVLAAARSIGKHMREYKLVATKSTVPVGTADKVQALKEELKQRKSAAKFSVVSNPEFLKEGAAVDGLHAPRPRDHRRRRRACRGAHAPAVRAVPAQPRAHHGHGPCAPPSSPSTRPTPCSRRASRS